MFEKTVEVKLLRAALENAGIPIPVPCPTCHGTGEVKEGPEWYVMKKCEVCVGSGIGPYPVLEIKRKLDEPADSNQTV